jgi:F420H(2)-dependent quinone reductase
VWRGTHQLADVCDGRSGVCRRRVVRRKPEEPELVSQRARHPAVVAQIGIERVPVTARIVLPDDADYERLWTLVNVNTRQRYAAYQRLTMRPIPIVVLDPA